MGKMGAGELNYSSDIDLIVFFDPAATSLVPTSSRRRSSCASRRRWRGCCSSAPATATCSASICAAAGSGLDAGGDVDRRGAALLRAGRADLGTRRDDQGAACAGDARAARRWSPNLRRSSGASIWILRRPRRLSTT
jgi:hypothetical protein